jgi:hypothetical protein
MIRKREVLPLPLRPMMPHRSPRATVRVTSLRIVLAPNRMAMEERDRRVRKSR